MEINEMEKVIGRVRTMLCYNDPKEVMVTLVGDGFKPEFAYLAIKAAQLCNKG